MLSLLPKPTSVDVVEGFVYGEVVLTATGKSLSVVHSNGSHSRAMIESGAMKWNPEEFMLLKIEQCVEEKVQTKMLIDLDLKKQYVSLESTEMKQRNVEGGG